MIDVCGFSVTVVVVIGMVALIIWFSTKCPRCFTKLVKHETYPNARICPSCKYLKVDN